MAIVEKDRTCSMMMTSIVTSGYAPFEQYWDDGKQGAWSDIYALAGVLYWMATGTLPQEAPARVRADNMAAAVQAGDRARFRPEFLAAIDWALSPFEDQRPQTVAEWREALLTGQVPEQRTEKVHTAPAPILVAPEVLKRAEEHLAEYIGPVAKVVVKRAAVKARDETELYLLLADEIEDKEERKTFVRQAVSVSGKP